MSVLPTGWVETSIGEVTKPFESVDPGRSPDTWVDYIDIGSIDNATQRITDPKRVLGRDAPSRARRRVKTGDVLFSTVRTYLKNIARVPPELDGALTSTGIALLRPSEALETAYLFHWVCSAPFLEAISKAQDGTMYPAVSDRDVSAASIKLPPLAEQRRIVAKLDVLTTRSGRARDELNRVPTLAERFKRAVLAAAFRGDLTASWRDLNPQEPTGPQSYQNLSLDDRERGSWAFDVLPEGWSWQAFSAVFDDVTDSKRKLPTKDYREIGLYPIVDQGAAKIAGYTDLEDFLQQAEPPYIVFGDHTRCVKFIDTRFAQGADGVKVFKIKGGGNPQYGALLIEALDLPNKGYSRHTKFLRDSYFPIAGQDEQAEVVRLVQSAFAEIDRLTAEAASARRLLDQLDQAVLAKAFRGELVPQDPTDEPATVLLGRIKAEHAKEGRKQNSRGGRTPTATKEQAMNGKPLPPRERILKDSENWPALGLPFEDIASRNPIPHDQLRDALFELLAGPSPALRQRFDGDAELMMIQRVPA